MLEEAQTWFVLFDEVRSYQKQREKTRLIYDHYVSKVEELRSAIAKKKSRNPSYQETTKEAERLLRVLSSQNDRKLTQATENFRSDSQKCTSTVYQALESRYEAVTPFVAKVSTRQIVNIEMELYKRAAGAVSTLRGVPEELLKANKEREMQSQEEQFRAQKKAEIQNKVPPGPALDPVKPQFQFDQSSEEDDGGFLTVPPGGQNVGMREFAANQQRQERSETMGGWDAPPQPREKRQSAWAAPSRKSEFEEPDFQQDRRSAAGARPQKTGFDEFDQGGHRDQRQGADPWGSSEPSPWGQEDPWRQQEQKPRPNPRAMPPERKDDPARRPPPPSSDYSQWSTVQGPADYRQRPDQRPPSDSAFGVGIPPRNPPKGSPFGSTPGQGPYSDLI